MSDKEYSENLYQAIRSEDEAEVDRLLSQNRDLNVLRSSSPYMRMVDFENIYPLEAACKTSEEMAYKLLDAGADADVVDIYLSGTPLIYALSANYEGRFRVARRLIDEGADIDHVDDNGRTALIKAAVVLKNDSDESREEELELMKYLLKNCDLDRVMKESENNPLAEAARYNNVAVVEYILDEEIIDIDMTAEGWTPLMRAVLSGSTDVCRILLERGADTEILSPTKQTAYDLAVEKNNTEIIELFEK